MGPGSSIPGFDNAQYRYDMHYDYAEADDPTNEEEEEDGEGETV